MKIFASMFALFTLASYGAPGTAQVATVVTPQNIKVDKVLPAVVSSPQFTVALTPPKQTTYLKWFEIEVDFEVKGVDLIDELTVHYDVLLNGKLCPGEVTHINIPKGPNHYSVMYISPAGSSTMSVGRLNGAPPCVTLCHAVELKSSAGTPVSDFAPLTPIVRSNFPSLVNSMN